MNVYRLCPSNTMCREIQRYRLKLVTLSHRESPPTCRYVQMSLTPKKRFRVLERYHFKCFYCGRPSSEVPLEVDHQVPKHMGGGDMDENLVATCRECNIGKGRYQVVDYSEELGPELMDTLRRRDYARGLEILGGDPAVIEWFRRFQRGEF